MLLTKKRVAKLLRYIRNSSAIPMLQAAIQDKWDEDSKTLPVTPNHYPLYKTIHRLCRRELGRFPNLISPESYNDKIQWLKLFDQDSALVACCDKLQLRNYIKSSSIDVCFPKVFQECDGFDHLDIGCLPERFVLKTNHYSGNVYIVRKKTSEEIARARKLIAPTLRKTYGAVSGEWPYTLLAPRLFAEEFIGTGTNSPPPDYKFHCVDGRVKWLQYIYDRGLQTKEVIVTPDGLPTPIHFDRNMLHTETFVRPPNWKRLLDVAEEASKPFKYVRVDLYVVDSRIYLGELTFFPYMGCYQGEGQEELGRLLTFSTKTYKPLVVH